MMHYGNGMMFLWSFFWFLLLGGLAAVAYVLLSRGRGERTATPAATTSSPSALAILDERLARGQIEPEDYRARRALLVAEDGSAVPPAAPVRPAAEPVRPASGTEPTQVIHPPATPPAEG